MRTVFVSAGILVISLGAAWNQFTDEPDKIGENEMLIMAGRIESITNISWTSNQQDVFIERRTDDLGTYLWVEYIDKKLPEDHKVKFFKAGKNGDSLLEKLSPFVGIRTIDPTIDIASIGLQEPSATFMVTSNGIEREFAIGSEAYGTRDLYVQDNSSKEIFLVDDAKLRSLRQARTSLPDRSLWTLDTSKATGGTLSFNEVDVQLSHQNWQDKKNAKWVFSLKPEDENTQLQTWLSKVLRLSVSRYASPDQLPTIGEEIFSLSLDWDANEQDTVSFYKDNEQAWWARSKHTRFDVKITGDALSGLVEDLPGLLE